MSLTSQLHGKRFNTSPVGRFFQAYEDPIGMRKCLSEMQSTKPAKHPGYKPADLSAWALIGTTTDYLIRYAANKYRLDFQDTIAGKTIAHLSDSSPWASFDRKTISTLFEIGMTYLDGRRQDQAAVYSATALALVDNFFRSAGRLPAYFDELRNPRHPMRDARRMEAIPEGYDFFQKRTMLIYYDYFCANLGDAYVRDILEILDIFDRAVNSEVGEFCSASFVVFNRVLGNSALVGGADFDCVVEKDGMLILTDIKTTMHKLPMESFRQIIGYALLHDEKKDKFAVDGVGIYYARSSSFRYYPLDRLIQTCLPSLKNIGAAKKAFLNSVQHDL